MPLGLTTGQALMAGGMAAGGIASGLGQASAGSAAAEQAAQQLAWTKQVYGDAQTNLQPYLGLGQAGVTAQQAALPGLTAPYTQAQYSQSPLYTPMVNNLAELQATPGYQFQLQQGQQALNNTAAAQGGMLSGATQQALANYSQNQAATGFANAWTRAQGAYTSAFSQNQAQNLQASNINTATANIGANAASNLGSIGVGAAGAASGSSQALGAANAAQASAPYGIASSLGGTLGAIGANMGGNTLGSIFGGIGSGNQGLSGMTMQGAGYTPAGGSFGTFGLGG